MHLVNNKVIMKKLFLTLFTAAVCLSACGPKTTYKYPFQDPSLKMEQRIENLLSLLTPEEKIGLLMNKSISVDSLGIRLQLVERGLPRHPRRRLHRVSAAHRHGRRLRPGAGV